MPFSLEAKRWGLKKESTRLTAETTPDKWLAVDSGSEISHRLDLLEDKGLRGVKAAYPSHAGIKVTDGKVTAPIRSSHFGEFLQMILGNPTTAEVEVGAAYKHTFLLPSGVQPPTYTFFIDRSMGVKKYNGVAVKKMTIKGNPDGFVQHDSELLGLDEAAGVIGTPVYTGESAPFTFQHVDVKLGGTVMTNLKEWSLSLDSGLFARRNPGQQVAVDVLAPSRMKVEGSLTVYFENETERAKFIANTTNTLQFLIEGATIAGTTKETLDINLYKIAYKAFPYGDLDGLLGAQATFEAVMSVADGKMIQVDLTNAVASY